MDQRLKFILVGGINTAFGYGIYFLLVSVHVDYNISFAISTILGIVFSYITYSRIVFGASGFDGIPKFVGLYLFNYVLGVLLINALVRLGVEPRASGAANIIVTTIISYSAQKYFVFRKRRQG